MQDKIRAKDAMTLLGTPHSTFYRILKKHRREIKEGISQDDAGLYMSLAALYSLANLAGLKVSPNESREPVSSPNETQAGVNGTQNGTHAEPNETRERAADSRPSAPDQAVVALREAIAVLREQLAEKDKVISGLIDNSAEERKRADHLFAMMGREVSEYRRQLEEARKPAERLLTVSPSPVEKAAPAIAPQPAKPAIKKSNPRAKDHSNETIGERLTREILEFFQPWRKREEFV